MFDARDRKPDLLSVSGSQVRSAEHHDSLGSLLMKVVFVGSSGVGKTNILTRFVYDEFNLTSPPTKGSEFAQAHYTIPANQSSSTLTTSYNFHLWDTQGQQRPRAACPAYYRDAVGVLLVYDVTNYDSFLDVEEIWAPEIREFAPANATVFLLGNKCDLQNLREVPTDEAAQFAFEHQMKFMEVSALDYVNIEQLFTELSRAIDPACHPSVIDAPTPASSSSSTSTAARSDDNDDDDDDDEFVLMGGEPVHQQRGTKHTLFAPPIKKFRVHVYFDSKDPLSRQSAEELHAQIKQQFPVLPLFPLHLKPIGPHSSPMFEVHLLNRLDFGALLPWLCLRRGQHSILVRPQTDDAERDFTIHAIWLGPSLPLRLEKLEDRTSIDGTSLSTN